MRTTYDIVMTVILVVAFAGLLMAPLIPGPYGGGSKLVWWRSMDDSNKYGIAVLLGLLGGMLALHVCARCGVI